MIEKSQFLFYDQRFSFISPYFGLAFFRMMLFDATEQSPTVEYMSRFEYNTYCVCTHVLWWGTPRPGVMRLNGGGGVCGSLPFFSIFFQTLFGQADGIVSEKLLSYDRCSVICRLPSADLNQKFFFT